MTLKRFIELLEAILKGCPEKEERKGVWGKGKH